MKNENTAVNPEVEKGIAAKKRFTPAAPTHPCFTAHA